MTFPKDPLRHTLVVGKTGTGKSTLLAKVAAGFINAGWGLCLVDPHGDLAQDVLAVVPRRRRNDLIVVDAASDDCPGLNPLAAVPGQDPSLVVSSLIATMRKVWPDNWGPRTEHILRHAAGALVGVRGATLELQVERGRRATQAVRGRAGQEDLDVVPRRRPCARSVTEELDECRGGRRV
jgi:hypothetical protein